MLRVGNPSFPQLYTALRPTGLRVCDILALCNAVTVALNSSQWAVVIQRLMREHSSYGALPVPPPISVFCVCL